MGFNPCHYCYFSSYRLFCDCACTYAVELSPSGNEQIRIFQTKIQSSSFTGRLENISIQYYDCRHQELAAHPVDVRGSTRPQSTNYSPSRPLPRSTGTQATSFDQERRARRPFLTIVAVHGAQNRMLIGPDGIGIRGYPRGKIQSKERRTNIHPQALIIKNPP